MSVTLKQGGNKMSPHCLVLRATTLLHTGELCARCGRLLLPGEAVVGFTRLRGRPTFNRVLFPAKLDSKKRPFMLIPCAGGYDVRRMKPALIARWLIAWNNENIPMRDNGWPEWTLYAHSRATKCQRPPISNPIPNAATVADNLSVALTFEREKCAKARIISQRLADLSYYFATFDYWRRPRKGKAAPTLRDEHNILALQSLDTPSADSGEEEWEAYIRLATELYDSYFGKNTTKVMTPETNAGESDRFERLAHNEGNYHNIMVKPILVNRGGGEWESEGHIFVHSLMLRNYVEQKVVEDFDNGALAVKPAEWRRLSLETFPVIPEIPAPQIIGPVYPKEKDRDSPKRAVNVGWERLARQARKLARNIHPSELDWRDTAGRLSWLVLHSTIKANVKRFKIDNEFYKPKPATEWERWCREPKNKTITVCGKIINERWKNQYTELFFIRVPSPPTPIVPALSITKLPVTDPQIKPRENRETQWYRFLTPRRMKKRLALSVAPELAKQVREFTIRQNSVLTHWPLWKKPDLGTRESRLSRLDKPFPYLPAPTPPRVGGQYEYIHSGREIGRLLSCGCPDCLRTHNSRLYINLIPEDVAEIVENRRLVRNRKNLS